jgi:membrane-bound metal-dependent hydrolase YbcI (DUF457 family)
MPFPIAHGLLGASIVVAASPQPIRANRAGLARLTLGALLGILPDLDYIGVWFLNVDEIWHRGFSHSLLVAIAVGSLLALWDTKGSRLRWAVVYSAAMASHGLLDALVSVKSGVALLWPLTSHRFAAGLLEYPDTINVKYYASADVLAIRDVFQLLRFGAIELVIMGGVLILTLIVRSRFIARAN